MNNFQFPSISRSTIVPAIIVGLTTMSGSATANEVTRPKLQTPLIERPWTAQSFSNTGVVTAPAPKTFESRITDFYDKLSATQEDLGADHTSLLMANLYSLYED